MYTIPALAILLDISEIDWKLCIISQKASAEETWCHTHDPTPAYKHHRLNRLPSELSDMQQKNIIVTIIKNLVFNTFHFIKCNVQC